MAALNFPPAPSFGDIYIGNGQSFYWDGAAWINMTVFIRKIGDTGLNGDLVWGTGTYNLLGTDGAAASMRFGFGFPGSTIGAIFAAEGASNPSGGAFFAY